MGAADSGGYKWQFQMASTVCLKYTCCPKAGSLENLEKILLLLFFWGFFIYRKY